MLNEATGTRSRRRGSPGHAFWQCPYQRRVGGVLPDSKVVAVGDLFTRNTPHPDLSAGGSLRGWGLALAETLKLDFDVVVPSAGSMFARADLEALKTKIDAFLSAH